MRLSIIGEYEVTDYGPGGDPASPAQGPQGEAPATLVLHHLVRGYDAVRLGAAAAAELGELLAVEQKRIRELGGYRVLLGGGGDLTIYDQLGRRACYLSGDQARQLARFLAS